MTTQPLNTTSMINFNNLSLTMEIPKDPLLELDDLLNSLLDDLYINPLHGYEPSIKFFHNKRYFLGNNFLSKQLEALRLLLSPDNLYTTVYSKKTATNLPERYNNSGDHCMSTDTVEYHGNNPSVDKPLGNIVDVGRQYFSYTPNADSSLEL